MRLKLKILLGLLAISLIGISIFLAISPASPLLYTLSKPKNYEECKKAGGTAYFEKVNSCIFKDKIFFEHNRPEIGAPESSKWATYADEENLFTLKYPATLFKEVDSEQSFQFLDKSYQSVSLVHEVNVEHCPLSGIKEMCTPNTTDISISITKVPLKYDDVMKAAQKQTGEIQELNTTNFVVKYTEQGAEGEGKYYYFIKLNENNTLLLTRSYINQEVLLKYKDSPEFIKFGEQQKILEDIINSIKVK